MAFVPTAEQTHMWLASSGLELQVKVPQRQLALQPCRAGLLLSWRDMVSLLRHG